MSDGNVSMVEAFGSLAWRMDNLYFVVDQDGREVRFRMRDAQRRLFSRMHTRNIVLKARQLGFTTFIDLLGLDRALFVPNTVFAIVAESLPKASEIFDKKIKYPYERLPSPIRDKVGIVSESGSRLELSNGSRISVTVSARSMTCNFLHISEYGPISARYPDKAMEILTGSFPSVHASGIIFVESTAMGASGCFYDMVRQAILRQGNPARLSRDEFRLHFFPWFEDGTYSSQSELEVPARLERYFDGLEKRLGISLSQGQRKWYAMKEATLHEEMWREYPSFADEAFQSAQDGAYYREQFDRILSGRRITIVPYEEALPVYTGWDLGISDDMSVWFVQFHGSQCRVIDYYASSGEGIQHYIRVLHDKGYRYGGHFAPHDISVREIGTGLSRMEVASSLGLRFSRVPTNQDVMGGIQAARELLEFCWFDASKCEEGLKCLQAYRREWDDRHGCYKDRPLHDWSSHGADSFRTLAAAWKMGLIRDAGLAGTQGSVSETDLHVTGGMQPLW